MMILLYPMFGLNPIESHGEIIDADDDDEFDDVNEVKAAELK